MCYRDTTRFTRDGEEGENWNARVKSKGGVTRDVQLHLFVMNEIRGYIKQRGQASSEDAQAATPLIAGLEIDLNPEFADQRLRASRLYDILQGIFA